MTPVESYLLPLIDGVPDIPILGSPEWDALHRDDPRKIASIARAALAWWRDGQPDAVRERLETDLAEVNRLAKWRTAQALAEIEDAWREHRRGRHRVVSWAELQQRRGEAA